MNFLKKLANLGRYRLCGRVVWLSPEEADIRYPVDSPGSYEAIWEEQGDFWRGSGRSKEDAAKALLAHRAMELLSRNGHL